MVNTAFSLVSLSQEGLVVVCDVSPLQSFPIQVAPSLLDDGSERSMLLPAPAESLGIKGVPEDFPLRTVQQDIQVLHGHKVSFHLSPAAKPKVNYKVDGTFTASCLSLAQHTYPLEHLQKSINTSVAVLYLP